MEVWVFGNPDYNNDALPLILLPELKKRFPKINFIIHDPNEEWKLPNRLIIIDTVRGIRNVTIFTSLKHFEKTSHITMHDFDLGMKLKWLQKLKKLPPCIVIGIPQGTNNDTALADVTAAFKKLF